MKLLAVLSIVILLIGCGGEKMVVKSVFENNERIPDVYTCTGRNMSPPLHIESIPPKAKSLAIVVDDPDAPIGTFVHWVAWNIHVTGSRMTIQEGIPRNAKFPQGRNDFGRIGYDGPCPPPGHGIHHYHFKVYALDTFLDLNEGASKKDLERAMRGHVIAQGELVGTYSR